MTKLQLEQYEKIAESILFAGGEPVDQKTVAQAMELDEDAAVAVLESLKTKYERFEGSIEVRRLETQWQLCTKAEYEPYIRGAFEIKRNAPLSQAALEVLAIIAYNQPVTRAFAEQVRGVDSSGVISTLVEKGLIEEAGRLDLPGRPVAYRTTDTFLRCFGISSLAELPPLPNQEGQLDFDELAELELEKKAAEESSGQQ